MWTQLVKINGEEVSASASELNTLSGVQITNDQLNQLSGIKGNSGAVRCERWFMKWWGYYYFK